MAAVGIAAAIRHRLAPPAVAGCLLAVIGGAIAATGPVHAPTRALAWSRRVAHVPAMGPLFDQALYVFAAATVGYAAWQARRAR